MSKRRIAITCSAVAIVCVIALVSCATVPAKQRSESIVCGNYMVSIGCAARLWAADNNSRFPLNFISMSNEISATGILLCPGDHVRRPAASWSTVGATNSSYEIISPGIGEDETNAVFIRCKIHGHLGYADGTVFDGVQRRRKIP